MYLKRFPREIIPQRHKQTIQLIKRQLRVRLDALVMHQHRYGPPPSAEVATIGYFCHRDILWTWRENALVRCQQLCEALIHMCVGIFET